MRNIERVAIIGAGTMGSAIAQHFCMKGLSVTLMDVGPDNLERGLGLLNASLHEAIGRKILTEAQKINIIENFTSTTTLSDVKDSDLVIEAVFEDLKVKQDLFKKLEKIVSTDCILATNTSSFQVTDVAKKLAHPERVVGVHYFYHAAKNKLVELIPGERTSPAILSRLNAFYLLIEKTPILVKDAPGFAVNRFFVPWLNEATRLYEEGCGSIPFIDNVACETFQIGMGPFALMNATGVPIAEHASQGLASALGKFYAPSNILKKQVRSRKEWDLNHDIILSHGRNDEMTVKERLIAASIGIAAQMVSEEVCDPTSTDLGARAGLRWPQGPFEMMNELGMDSVQSMVEKLFLKWDLSLPRFPFSQTDSKQISLDWVRSFTNEKSGYVEFNLPDKMNPLSETMMQKISDRFDGLQNNPDVERIIFLGKGKAFVAGADVKFFVEQIQNNDLDRIYRFTEFGQRTLDKISSSKKPTIAYLNGLTLGGGLELALACQHRIATRKAVFAFPETGIGIYPGLGGTQRTPRLIGKGLAKFLIATGQFLNAKTALSYGLVDQVIDTVLDPIELSSLPIPKRIPAQTDTFPETAFSTFDGQLTPDLFQNEVFKKYERPLKFKAPLALKKAMELVDRGSDLSLADALKLELSGLKEIFSTKDARTGLSSLIHKIKPNFVGK